MKNLQANLLKIESTQIGAYAGDTAGDSIITTGSGSASKGETAQQYGQSGIISNPAKNTIGLRLRKGSLDIIVASNLYSVPLPEKQGETLLYSTDADGAIKSKLYLNDQGQFIFNDGTDNAVRYSALETAYNELNSKYNKLISTMLAWIPVPSDGGLALKTALIAAAPLNSTGDITPSKIEEIIVT